MDPPGEPPEGPPCLHPDCSAWTSDPARTSDPRGWTTLRHDTRTSAHLEQRSAWGGPGGDSPRTRYRPTFPSVLSWKLSTRAASVHLAATSRAAFRRRSWSSREGGRVSEEDSFETPEHFGSPSHHGHPLPAAFHPLAITIKT